MHTQSILAFAGIAALSIMSPGPSIVLTLRNGVAFGPRSVMCSAFGNVSGVFCLSAAAMLGLGVMLATSAWLFAGVKVVGAAYLFYIGARQLFGHSALVAVPDAQLGVVLVPAPLKLWTEAFLTAATNPKAILFFTALFPQFVSTKAPLMPQFFTLTGVFMCLSYLTHLSYALLAARARRVLLRAQVAKWTNRLAGSAFVAFDALLLALRREVA